MTVGQFTQPIYFTHMHKRMYTIYITKKYRLHLERVCRTAR